MRCSHCSRVLLAMSERFQGHCALAERATKGRQASPARRRDLGHWCDQLYQFWHQAQAEHRSGLKQRPQIFDELAGERVPKRQPGSLLCRRTRRTPGILSAAGPKVRRLSPGSFRRVIPSTARDSAGFRYYPGYYSGYYRVWILSWGLDLSSERRSETSCVRQVQQIGHG